MKIGISLSPQHVPKEYYEKSLKHPEIDFVEIAIEGFIYRKDFKAKETLQKILDHKPATAHGYSLSLLDPSPWEDNKLELHEKFLNSNSFLAWADHYALTTLDGIAFSSLTPAPIGIEAENLLNKRLSIIESKITSCPFYFENPAAPFLMEHQNSAVNIFPKCFKGRKSKMLLDISNLVANEINFGISADMELEKLNGVSIGEIHLAGGEWHENFYRDTHSSPVNKRSWDLLKQYRSIFEENTLIVIEREQKIPPFEETLEETRRVRSIFGI
ncbi:DUF692 family protein [Silvanigrella paludirubra]|uniref:DUF692 family protein n=1 Tax=Silvanigrella paludirubra TaxID=2499159 RepID=A0A6N6VXR8_9BACT|nr:DUF692 family multinuclear iron-containing protein [Silvanigrella paludirubra]KAB8040839.1 DUF692 family protein [Silvanigrella paludirubra]